MAVQSQLSYRCNKYLYIFLFLLAPLAAFPDMASTTTLAFVEQKITPKDGKADSHFGWCVSISGNTAIIGAPYDTNEKGESAGAAYIFQLQGFQWVEITKLMASDGESWDQFGRSVAVSGDTAIVGSYADNTLKGEDSGSVHIFNRNRGGADHWGELGRILASDAHEYDRFGCSVSLSNNYAIIGAYTDDDKGADSGSAYIFEYDDQNTTWTQKAKLLANDGADGDRFGYSVSIYDKTAIVGALYHDLGEKLEAGAAYIFEKNDSTWEQKKKITAVDAGKWDNFGSAVSLYQDTALIGTPKDGDNGFQSGASYVFRREGNFWIQKKKLKSIEIAENDWFGCAVCIYGDTAVVGAELDDRLGDWSGSAFLFQRNEGGEDNWGEMYPPLTAFDGHLDERFGYSVSIWEKIVIIGAYRDNENGHDSGSAYISRFIFEGLILY